MNSFASSVPLDLVATLFGAALFVAIVFAVAHAALSRREVGSALAWIGLILLVPFVGLLLYWMFGINRVARRARRLRGPDTSEPGIHALQRCVDRPRVATAATDPDRDPAPPDYLHAGARLSRMQLANAHSIEVEPDAAMAYEQMLRCIDTAQESVRLASYWFAPDRTGRRFVAALARARARDVRVHVLIDAVGTRHTPWKTVLPLLRRAGVPVALFNPIRPPRHLSLLHLRSHRKLLVIDRGRASAMAFTGGMNIHDGHADGHIKDLAFLVHGAQATEGFAQVFDEDWRFATGETLRDASAPPASRSTDSLPRRHDADPSIATPCRHDDPEHGDSGPEHGDSNEAHADTARLRVLPDGPDEDFEVLPLMRAAALSAARSEVRIVTPYFLPEPALVGGLKAAALRGVDVVVLIPERSNHRLVDWASRPLLLELIERGVCVMLTPAPFVHAKLMTVDRLWALAGSSNWDPRSLRLNFECDVEIMHPETLSTLSHQVQRWIAASRVLTAAELRDAPLAARLRDALARLASPYL